MLGLGHLCIIGSPVVDFGLKEVGVGYFLNEHLSKLDGFVEWIVDGQVIYVTTSGTRMWVEVGHLLLVSSVWFVWVDDKVELVRHAVVATDRKHHPVREVEGVFLASDVEFSLSFISAQNFLVKFVISGFVVSVVLTVLGATLDDVLARFQVPLEGVDGYKVPSETMDKIFCRRNKNG